MTDRDLLALYADVASRRADASTAYLDAEDLAPEEYHRGYRDGLDEVLGLLEGIIERITK